MTAWRTDSLISSYFLDEKKGNGVGLEPGGHIPIVVGNVQWNMHDEKESKKVGEKVRIDRKLPWRMMAVPNYFAMRK